MTETVLRWEWRSFGSHFDRAEGVLIALGAIGEPQASDELYLVGPEGSNLKIRSELLDLKNLLEQGQDGLQLWAPTLKAGFPIDAEQVSALFDAWGPESPILERPSYTQQQFIDELIMPLSGVSMVKVHKSRVRYAPEGCIAELTDLSADGWATSTVAVESADRAAITSAIRELGLSGYENASYGRGLTCLLGLAPARFAVIDVGTNSVKFHIGEHHEDGTWSRVADRAEVTRLGEGLDESGEIQREPMERTAEAISGMVEEARRSGVLVIDAVGTAGLRIARNRDAVLSRFHERAGIGVDVISGEEESRLAYLAATSELAQSEGSAVVFDTGGGSTQFTFGRGGVVDERFSVDVGAVPYTERFGLDHAVSAQVVQEALAAISHGLSRIKGRQTPDELVAMGGAVTNLAAISHSLVEYDADVVQGTILGLDEIDRQIELFRSMDSESRRSIVGIQPDRSEVILAGACIVRTVMEQLGCNELTVSDRGLRHGILRERLGLFRAAHPTA